MDRDAFIQKIETDGMVILENVLDLDFVQQARVELEKAIQREVEYHGTAAYPDYGMVLLCALYGGSFWSLFDQQRLIDPFEWVLGPGCIVYAYTSSSLPPNGCNYSTRIHVDCPRLIPGYITNMGATILLDDFTPENGATWLLPGSHQSATAPDEAAFYKAARRLVTPAGSVCFFNARVWHTSAPNQTQAWRHALTINMCRPYMKQRLDIPRALSGMDLSAMTEKTRQKLGFCSQVAASYDEYYVPPEQRKFTQPVE